jgi:Ni/Co efflux regulator RcnB
MFKKIVLAAAALSMLAAPVAQAQAQPSHSQHWSQPKKPVIQKKKPVHKWSRGHKVPNWKKQQHVRDYGRYGLHRPARGQEWIKVGNDYLLVSIASGIIASIVASR